MGPCLTSTTITFQVNGVLYRKKYEMPHNDQCAQQGPITLGSKQSTEPVLLDLLHGGHVNISNHRKVEAIGQYVTEVDSKTKFTQ